MSAISEAIAKHRTGAPRRCLAAEWLNGQDPVDQIELAEYAAEHVASAYHIAVEFGFGHSRSVWTQHFKGRCGCPKGEG